MESMVKKGQEISQGIQLSPKPTKFCPAFCLAHKKWSNQKSRGTF